MCEYRKKKAGISPERAFASDIYKGKEEDDPGMYP